MAVTLDQVRTMRIGLVVDSACDLPKEFIERHRIEILPTAVRIDGTTEVDSRDQAATLAFLESPIAERGVNAGPIPYPVEQTRDLCLPKLDIDSDQAFFMTITSDKK